MRVLLTVPVLPELFTVRVRPVFRAELFLDELRFATS